MSDETLSDSEPVAATNQDASDEIDDLAALAGRIMEASEPEEARSLAAQIIAALTRSSEEEQLQQRERESHSLAQIKGITRAGITAGSLGLVPLSEDSTGAFAELVEEYHRLLDLAVDERIYRVDNGIHHQLRSLAEQAGFLNAGPRDVVELHTAALKAATQGTTPLKTRAYTQEGRLMVLELMGYLATHYRNYCAIPVRGTTTLHSARRSRGNSDGR